MHVGIKHRFFRLYQKGVSGETVWAQHDISAYTGHSVSKSNGHRWSVSYEWALRKLSTHYSYEVYSRGTSVSQLKLLRLRKVE